MNLSVGSIHRLVSAAFASNWAKSRAKLKHLPTCAEVVVVALDSGVGDKQIVAYVQLAAAHPTIPLEKTRSTLQRGMPFGTLQRPVAVLDAGASPEGSHAAAWSQHSLP